MTETLLVILLTGTVFFIAGYVAGVYRGARRLRTMLDSTAKVREEASRKNLEMMSFLAEANKQAEEALRARESQSL